MFNSLRLVGLAQVHPDQHDPVMGALALSTLSCILLGLMHELLIGLPMDDHRMSEGIMVPRIPLLRGKTTYPPTQFGG